MAPREADLPATRAGRLLLLLAALTAWRWLAAAHRHLELYADEAQYWFWSLQPDWGYYSKPPMVAWLIRLGTTLFGDGELGVRAASFLLWPATAWVIFLLVRRLYRDETWGERAAFWSALAFATLPMVSLGSWLITTDAPLLLCWALSLYFLVRALQDHAWRDWLALGACFGLGMLSKYSMAFFVPALLLYLWLTPSQRAVLRSPRPWVAALVAVLVLAPNLYWNIQHEFVSYRHTAEISQLQRAWLHPGAALAFLLAQFAVFGPLLAAALVTLTARPRRLWQDPRMRLLALFCLFPLAAFAGLSLLSRAFANWAAFAYVAGAALVAVGLLARGRLAWLVAALTFNLLLGATLYHYHDLARALDFPLTRKTDPTYRLAGNRALGALVTQRLAEYPRARLLGDDRKSFAVLLYYARPRSLDAAYLNPSREVSDHFALMADVERSPDGEFLLVSRHASDEQVNRWFREVTPLPGIRVQVLPDYARDYHVWWVRDFRGY